MFDKINLTIYSPDKSKTTLAEVNTILTVGQVLEELRQNRFFSDKISQQCRQLLVESSGCILSEDCTLSSIGDHETVRAVVFSEARPSCGDRITVTFLHPRDANSIEVEVTDSITAEEAVQELMACGFLSEQISTEQSYTLFIKNSQKNISGNQTLASGGAVNGSVLTVQLRTPY